MKTIYLALLGLSLSSISHGQVQTPQKENGWCHIIGGQPKHCKHEQNIETYKTLEESLEKELQKPNFSSRSADYMTSDAYKKYKSYVCEYPDYINIMFQGFLFQESVKGLYGHLIDDIVKTRYPNAPSIWIMAANTNHKDDEISIILTYQRRVSQLMDEERNKKENTPNDISANSNQPDNKLAWEKAYQYRATITDSTFLKTKGSMSDQAIDALVPGGWNNNHAYNQVVYLKALERAKRHLSVKNNQFIYPLKSGEEINVSEDIHQYIYRLFEDWNRWVTDGRCKITKDENGFYDIAPIINSNKISNTTKGEMR